MPYHKPSAPGTLFTPENKSRGRAQQCTPFWLLLRESLGLALDSLPPYPWREPVARLVLRRVLPTLGPSVSSPTSFLGLGCPSLIHSLHRPAASSPCPSTAGTCPFWSFLSLSSPRPLLLTCIHPLTAPWRLARMAFLDISELSTELYTWGCVCVCATARDSPALHAQLKSGIIKSATLTP